MGLSRIAPIPEMNRAGLMQLMDAASDRRVVYIHTPAGYGKTFTTRMWLKHRGGVSAWVTVKKSLGNKREELIRRLVCGLIILQPANAELKEVASQMEMADSIELLEQALRAFYVFSAGVADPKTTLVIDDFHFVSNSEMIKLLPDVILVTNGLDAIIKIKDSGLTTEY